MDLCLECKGCKAECPANVDMAKMKYEFLHHYYQANGLPLRNRLFGHIARLNALLSRVPDLANWMSAVPFNRWLMEKVAGIDRRRPLPALAEQTFTDWFAERTAPAAAPRGEVVLFHDTFVTYNTPEIGRAAVQLLEAAGYKVVLVDRKCCGRPLISKGMLTEARDHAAWNVERLLPYAAARRRHRRPRALVPSHAARRVGGPAAHRRGAAGRQAERAARAVPAAREASGGWSCAGRRMAARRCCTATATRRRSSARRRRSPRSRGPATRSSEIDSGCCGMAGSFGFEREHYDISVTLGNRRLAPAVKAAAGGHRGRGARHLVPTADPAPGRPAGQASGRGPVGGARALMATTEVEFNPFLPEFHADPYPFYRRLREQDPVHRTAMGFWVLTRYEDCVAVLRDQRFGREEFQQMLTAVYGDDTEKPQLPRSMLFRDPPDHTRLRALVSKAFTPRTDRGDARPHPGHRRPPARPRRWPRAAWT